MIDVNDVMWEGWPQHRGLRPLLFSNSGVGSFTSHKNQISVSKCCETGSIVFHPYPSRAERQCNRSQMSLQRQHFLLSYLKTLSVGPAGVRTRDLPLSRPALSQLSQPGGGWSVYSGKLTENRQVVSFAWYSWWRICCWPIINLSLACAAFVASLLFQLSISFHIPQSPLRLSWERGGYYISKPAPHKWRERK